MSAILSHRVYPPNIDDDHGGKEIYMLKFRDSKDRQGLVIHNEDKPMKILKITLAKAMGKNNCMVLEILKDKSNNLVVPK